ncbi:MAG: hypothetical protein ACOC2F_06775 [Bacteroidota bacterium]
MKQTILFLSLLITLFSCEKKDETKKATIYSSGSEDAMIINSSPRIVRDYVDGFNGMELRIGWDDNGMAMRAFLVFDLTSIQPPADEILEIEQMVLTIVESNTNLHPFDGDNGQRTVLVDIIDSPSVVSSLFNITPAASCGTIADWGYAARKDYSLDITSEVKGFLNESNSTSNLMIRLRFYDDNNIANPDESDLNSSTWNIYSGDEPSDDYKPRLTITYKHIEE